MRVKPASAQRPNIKPCEQRPVTELVAPNTLNAPRLLDILLACGLVLGGEEAGGVLAEPLRQLGEFLAEAVDGLLVHVGLGDELGHGDWWREMLVVRFLGVE